MLSEFPCITAPLDQKQRHDAQNGPQSRNPPEDGQTPSEAVEGLLAAFDGFQAHVVGGGTDLVLQPPHGLSCGLLGGREAVAVHAAGHLGRGAADLAVLLRAVSLDRQPLPQLSAGAWQLKERGIEVAAVQVWREIKEQAVEVARVAQELAEKGRAWLERVAERAAEQVRDVVERVTPADAWADFFAAAAPGASAAAEGLAQDLEVERRQEAQREAAEREARERERRAHERDRGDDHGW